MVEADNWVLTSRIDEDGNDSFSIQLIDLGRSQSAWCMRYPPLSTTCTSSNQHVEQKQVDCDGGQQQRQWLSSLFVAAGTTLGTAGTLGTPGTTTKDVAAHQPRELHAAAAAAAAPVMNRRSSTVGIHPSAGKKTAAPPTAPFSANPVCEQWSDWSLGSTVKEVRYIGAVTVAEQQKLRQLQQNKPPSKESSQQSAYKSWSYQVRVFFVTKMVVMFGEILYSICLSFRLTYIVCATAFTNCSTSNRCQTHLSKRLHVRLQQHQQVAVAVAVAVLTTGDWGTFSHCNRPYEVVLKQQ
jgi:hypothetical protein